MPRVQDLPDALHGLARRQAIQLSQMRWDMDDIGVLVEHLKHIAEGRASAPENLRARK